jgi:hypothetical protein
MNIELVKQEIKALNTLIEAWQQGKEVSAIERQVALNKLSRLYELIGLDNSPAEDSYTAPIPVVADPADEQEADDTEQEVEVEIIFAEEDEQEEENTEEPETDIAPAAETEVEVAPEPESEVEAETEPIITEQPETEEQPEIEKTPIIEEPVVDIEPASETKPIVEAEPVQEIKTEPQEEKPRLAEYQAPMMESLFGAEEIQRKPRSKHQRMMAIYEEAQPKQEKVVDISKIFDMDGDSLPEVEATKPTTSKPATPAEPIIVPETTTLADTLTPTPTLADSITAPAALAEEITNSKIDSLHQAIGINDKFLMIRDLFDGDDKAYDDAIAALDEQPSLEECMIYIIENYQWNPDAEGSKFIMQLLERKFS